MGASWVQIATCLRQRLSPQTPRLTRARDYLDGIASGGSLRTGEEAA
jgi:hypothetical protein